MQRARPPNGDVPGLRRAPQNCLKVCGSGGGFCYNPLPLFPHPTGRPPLPRVVPCRAPKVFPPPQPIHLPPPLARPQRARAAGVGRTAISAGGARLLASRLVGEGEVDRPGGGRPSRLLQLSAQAGVVAAIDVGATSLDVALTTLAGLLGVWAVRVHEARASVDALKVVARWADRSVDERGFGGSGAPGKVGRDE